MKLEFTLKDLENLLQISFLDVLIGAYPDKGHGECLFQYFTMKKENQL